MKSHFKSIEYWILLIYGMFLGLYTLSYSQNEDMGIFLTETSLIARGSGLYSQIFEVKDPLFLWMGGASNWLFGLRGPYLVDGIFVMASPLVVYLFSQSLKISKTWSVIAAIAFSGSLSGIYFQSLRSGTAALVLIICALWACQKKNWILCGVLAALVIGFKMAYAPALAGVGVYVMAQLKIKPLVHSAFGFIATISSIMIVMMIRGELGGYVQMVELNFHYRKIFPSAIGFQPGVAGHINVINSFGSNFKYLLLALACVLLTCKNYLANKELLIGAVALLMTFVGCIFFLLSSAMWSHHLQPLCLVLLVVVLMVGQYIDNSQGSNSIADRALSIIVVIILVGTFNVTGWKFPMKPQMQVSNWLNPTWIKPAEISFLEKNNSKLTMDRTFARLGPNDDNGLGGFISTDWKLVCRHYAQYGHETPAIVNEISKCISSKPNYVFISPGFLALERLSGTYNQLKTDAMRSITQNFKCVGINERPGSQFCTRTN
jgi:hypothetical protein